MHPPLPRTNLRPTKWTLALLMALVWGLFLYGCQAATITFGAPIFKQRTPFGLQNGAPFFPPERYQQIYLGSLFPSACWITTIAFMDFDSPVTWDAHYNLSIGLKTTTNSPGSVGAGPESGTTPAFSGSHLAQLTVEANDWDFSIPLTTPFFYDPALGNLLLDVTTSSITGTPGAGVTTGCAAAHGRDDIGSWIRSRSGMGARPNTGLYTQFTVTPVPEPATGALLLLGAALGIPWRGRWKVVNVSAVAFSMLALDSSAATITFGGGRTKDQYPFGITSSDTAAYVGRYQQIYDSSGFPSANVIAQLEFPSSYFLRNDQITYTLSLGLGVTDKTPAFPGIEFASGAISVFSGPILMVVNGPFAVNALQIPLTTPFLYDPALGNLLLDVTIVSATGMPGQYSGGYFNVDETTTTMARIFSKQGSVVGVPNEGLVTRFIVTPVPEPTTGALLLLGTALGIPWRVRAPFRLS